MALTKIEFGSLADPEIVNNNFEYLDEKITDASSKIYNNNADLESLINSQISTTFTQLSTKITENIQALYPVGSVYIGTTTNCPLASLFGTWEKVAEGLCLQGAKGSQVPGKTVEAGLPNITGSVEAGPYVRKSTGAFTSDNNTRAGGGEASAGTSYMSTFDASRSNSIYGKSNTVQPPAYLVNIWRRTA